MPVNNFFNIGHGAMIPGPEGLPDRDDIFRLGILDGQGIVEFIDSMGSDLRVVQAARVSRVGSIDRTEESSRRLIRFLMANGHWTPFEHVVFTFAVRAPIFVTRQWMRHRAAAYNELSGRYAVLEEGEYLPPLEAITGQDPIQKQVAGALLPHLTRELAQDILAKQFLEARAAYHTLLDLGVAKEMARLVLPVSTMTEFYFTTNLRMLFHFLELRLDKHAQPEIQQYAFAMAHLIKNIVPECWIAWAEEYPSAYYDYRRVGVSLGFLPARALEGGQDVSNDDPPVHPTNLPS